MLKSIFRKWGLDLEAVNLQTLQIEGWKEKGLKSPKLSKYLLGRGISEKEVSDTILFIKKYISENNLERVAELTNSRKDIINQGISATKEDGNQYFFSCQTPNNMHWRGDEDLIPASRNDLVMWVVRGEGGFKFRAKVRTCYNYDGELMGFYVDRPYGDVSLTNFRELADLLKKFYKLGDEQLYYIFKAPIWKREDGVGANFQAKYGGLYKEKLSIPSASCGYQDTLYTGEEESKYFDFFTVEEYINKNISEEEILYTHRLKKEGVYMADALDFELEAERMSVKFNMKNIYKCISDQQWATYLVVSMKEFIRFMKLILNIEEMDYKTALKLGNLYMVFLNIAMENPYDMVLTKDLTSRVLSSNKERYSTEVDLNICLGDLNYRIKFYVEDENALEGEHTIGIYLGERVARRTKAESYYSISEVADDLGNKIEAHVSLPYIVSKDKLRVTTIVVRDKLSGEYLILDYKEEALEMFDRGEVDVLYFPPSYIWENDNYNEENNSRDAEEDYVDVDYVDVEYLGEDSDEEVEV